MSNAGYKSPSKLILLRVVSFSKKETDHSSHYKIFDNKLLLNYQLFEVQILWLQIPLGSIQIMRETFWADF